MTAAVFLDRDGVINQGVMDEEDGAFESPYHADDVVLEDRAVEGLRVLEGLGVPSSWPPTSPPRPRAA